MGSFVSNRSNIDEFTEAGSYITPEIDQIRNSYLNRKQRKNFSNEIKDEFDHMVDWKRVFE